MQSLIYRRMLACLLGIFNDLLAITYKTRIIQDCKQRQNIDTINLLYCILLIIEYSANIIHKIINTINTRKTKDWFNKYFLI